MKGKQTKIYKINSVEKNFIDTLVHCPEDQFRDILSKFKDWPFGKSEDFNHWVDVIDRIDSIINRIATKYYPPQPSSSSTANTTSQSSTSSSSNKVSSIILSTQNNKEPTIPCILVIEGREDFEKDKEYLISIIKFLRNLLRNCSNSSLYCSLNELLQLFAFPNFEILVEVIKLLNVLFGKKKFIKENISFTTQLLSKLSVMSHGFSEDNLELNECCKENINIPKSLNTLLFEFYKKSKSTVNNNNNSNNNINNSNNSNQQQQLNKININSSSILYNKINISTIEENGKIIIKLFDIDKINASSYEISKQLIQEIGIPEEDHFFIHFRVSVLKNFSNFEFRKKWVQLRLISISTIYHNTVTQFYNPSSGVLAEPDFFNELLDLLKNYTNVPEQVSVAAVYTFASLTSHLQSAIFNQLVIKTFSQGFFPSIIRKCVYVVTGEIKDPYITEPFINSIFYFVFKLSNKSILHETGVFQSLLPLIKNHTTHVNHIIFQINSLQIIQSLLLVKPYNIEMFSEQGYLQELIKSISEEVEFILSHPKQEEVKEDLVVENNYFIKKQKDHNNSNTSPIIDEKKKKSKKTLTESLSTSSITTTTTSSSSSSSTIEESEPMDTTNINYKFDELVLSEDYLPKILTHKSILLHGLMGCLISITLANGIQRAILNEIVDSSIHQTLKKILDNSQIFSPVIIGDVFSIPTNLVQSEPTCFSAINNTGIIDLIFEYILTKELTPDLLILSSEALNAFSLNSTFKTKVSGSTVIKKLLKVIVNPKNVNSLNISTLNTICNSIDELIRHHPELKINTIREIVNLLDDIIALAPTTSNSKQPVTEKSIHCQMFNFINKFITLFISNGEHDRIFLQEGGLDKLLEIYTNPQFIFKELMIFKSLSIENTPIVLKSIIKALNKCFTTLDSLCDWRNSRIIRDWVPEELNNRESIQSTIDVIKSLVLILNSLIKGHSQEIPIAVLDEWSKDVGISVFSSLCTLQKALYWEFSLEKDSIFCTSNPINQLSKPSDSTSSSSSSTNKTMVRSASTSSVEQRRSNPNENVQNSPPPRRTENHHEAFLNRIIQNAGSRNPNIENLIAFQSSLTASINSGVSSATLNALSSTLTFNNQSLLNHLVDLSRFFIESLNPNNKRDPLSYEAKSETLIKNIALNLVQWIKWKPEHPRDTEKKEQYYSYFSKVTYDTFNLLYPQLISALSKADYYTILFQSMDEMIERYLELNEPVNSIYTTPLHQCSLIIRSSVHQLTVRSLKSATEKILPPILSQIVKYWNHKDLVKLPFTLELLESVNDILNYDKILSTILQVESAAASSSSSSKKPIGLQSPRIPFAASESSIATLTDMGFFRDHIEKAMNTLLSNNVDNLTDWMLSHPYVPKDEEKEKKEKEEKERLEKERLEKERLEKEKLNSFENLVAELRPTLFENTLKILLASNKKNPFTSLELEKVTKLIQFIVKDSKIQDSKDIVVNKLIEQLEDSIPKEDFKSNNIQTKNIFYILQKLNNEVSEVHSLLVEKNLLSIIVNTISELLNKYLSKSNDQLLINLPSPSTTTTTNEDSLSSSSSSALKSTNNQQQQQQQQQKEKDNILSFISSLLVISYDLYKKPNSKPTNYDYEVEEKKQRDIDEGIKKEEVSDISYQLLDICIALLKPASSFIDQPLLKLLTELTKNYTLATHFLKNQGMQLLLAKNTNSSSSKEIITNVSLIFKNMLEDRKTFYTTVQTDIKHIIQSSRIQKGIPIKNILGSLSKFVVKNPTLFLKACVEICRIHTSSNSVYLAANANETIEKNIGDIKDFPHFEQISLTLIKALFSKDELIIQSPKEEKSKKSKSSSNNLSTSTILNDNISVSNQNHSNEKFVLALSKSNILKLLEEILLQYPMFQKTILSYQGVDLIQYVIENFLPCSTATPEDKARGDYFGSSHQNASRFLLALCATLEGREKVINHLGEQLKSSINEYLLSNSNVQNKKTQQNKMFSISNFVNLLLNFAPHSLQTEFNQLFINCDMINLLLQVLNIVDMSNSRASEIINSLLQTIGHLTKFSSLPKPTPEEDAVKTNLFALPYNVYEGYVRTSRDLQQNISFQNIDSIDDFGNPVLGRSDIMVDSDIEIDEDSDDSDMSDDSSSLSDDEDDDAIIEIEPANNVLMDEGGEEIEDGVEEDDINAREDDSYSENGDEEEIDELVQEVVDGDSDEDNDSDEIPEDEEDEEEEEDDNQPRVGRVEDLLRPNNPFGTRIRNGPPLPRFYYHPNLNNIHNNNNNINNAPLLNMFNQLGNDEGGQEIRFGDNVDRNLSNFLVSMGQAEQNIGGGRGGIDDLIRMNTNQLTRNIERFEQMLMNFDIQQLNNLRSNSRLRLGRDGNIYSVENRHQVIKTDIDENNLLAQSYEPILFKLLSKITKEEEAIQKAKEKKEKEEKDRLEKEEKDRQEKERIEKERIEKEREEKERLEREEKEREERERLQSTNTTLDSNNDNNDNVPETTSPINSNSPLIEGENNNNIDQQSIENDNNNSSTTDNSSLPSNSTTTTSSNDNNNASSSSTTSNQPRSVDLGIDPTFLSALPPELRAEVLSTQINSIHQNEGQNGPITISQDFLSALPVEIQNEVLEQERIISERRRASQARQQQQQQAAAIVDPNLVQDMDNASFLATLPPDLREEVLLTQPEAFLQTLPPELHAEAIRLRESNPVRMIDHRMSIPERIPSPRSLHRIIKEPPKPKKINQSGSIVKKENLVALIKILYLDQPINKPQLNNIFSQICSFSENREQLLTYLLQILTCYDIIRKNNQNSIGFTDSEKFSPLQDPCHQLMKYKSFRFFEVSTHPPLQVVKKILDILFLLTFGNQFTTQWMLEPQSIIPKTESLHGKESTTMMIDNSNESSSNEKIIPLWKLCNSLSNHEIFSKPSHIDRLVSILLAIVDTNNNSNSNVLNSSSNSVSSTSSTNKIPVFPSQYIETLVQALMNNIYNPKISQLLVTIAFSSDDNKKIVLDQLNSNLKKLTKDVVNNLENMKKVFKDSQISPLLYIPNSTKETNFLHILQTINSILNPKPTNSSNGNNNQVSSPSVQSSTSSPQVNNNSTNTELSTPTSSSTTTTTSTTSATPTPATTTSENSNNNNNNETTSSTSQSTTTTSSTSSPSTSTTTTTTTITNNKKEVQISLNDYFSSNYELDQLWSSIKSFLTFFNNDKQQQQQQQDEQVTKEKLTSKKKSGPLPMTSLLLPLVEMYFLVNSPTTDQLLTNTVPSSPSLASLKLSSSHGGSIPASLSSGNIAGGSPSIDYNTSRFFEFVEQNKSLINDLIRQDSNLLSGSLSVLVKTPKFLDFDNKRTYFRSYFNNKKERVGTIRLKVRRNHIFEDSYNQLRMRSPEELKGKLNIQFSGEEGLDAGGLLREWYLVLSREMFNPNYALFKTSASDNVTFQPNPESYINPDHLSYFKFIGRIIGKALYDGMMLDAFFTRSFYKHMLGLTITVNDMEAIDPTYHKNLLWILDNDITNVLDLTFSTEIDIFDSTKVIELKPGGANIPVTEDNKLEYVRLVASARMTNTIKEQITSFLAGFHEIIPKSLIGIFNEMELELLISGLPEIDIDDLRANTEYNGYTADSPQIIWFWNTVSNFSNEEKASLLQFVTGTSKVPLDGFKSLGGMGGLQKFQIHRLRGNPTRLPSAHTCFNQLDLPEYESQDQLKRQLKLAILEASEGFGFH